MATVIDNEEKKVTWRHGPFSLEMHRTEVHPGVKMESWDYVLCDKQDVVIAGTLSVDIGTHSMTTISKIFKKVLLQPYSIWRTPDRKIVFEPMAKEFILHWAYRG